MNAPSMQRLSLANMKDLDFGIVDAAFQKAVGEVAKDCQDREHLDVDREVSVTFKLRPTVNKKAGTADGDKIRVVAAVVYKIPKKTSEEYVMQAKADGSLFFKPHDPADPTPDLFDPETGELKEDRREDGGRK